MRLTELQNKDIVDIESGRVIGGIIDIALDESGILQSLVVEKSKFLISLFSSKDEIEVKWKQIEKIGEDVILVKLTNDNEIR